MKILFDNVVIGSTITSPYESLNYPADNLQDEILRRRYQSSRDIDTITIAFEDEADVSCFFWAFTNATQMILRLYNFSDELIFSQTIDDPDQLSVIYFDRNYAASAEIDITGSTTGVYLGGVGLGEEVTFPDPDYEWPENYTDNSVLSSSKEGQTLQNYVEPLRVHQFNFSDLTRNEMNAIKELYESVGIGYQLWFDFFEDDHDFIGPMYGFFSEPIQPKKNGRRYNFTITVREAR